MGTTTGRLREPVTGYPENQMIGGSGNVRGTCVIDVFFNSTQKHVKITFTNYSRLYSEL